MKDRQTMSEDITRRAKLFCWKLYILGVQIGQGHKYLPVSLRSVCVVSMMKLATNEEANSWAYTLMSWHLPIIGCD